MEARWVKRGEESNVDCDCEMCVAPEGYEYVLLPARPDFGGGKAPGETGHYSDLNPEPIQVFEAWGLDGLEFTMLKYGARYQRKGGVEDLKKVKFYADRLIAREIREGRG